MKIVFFYVIGTIMGTEAQRQLPLLINSTSLSDVKPDDSLLDFSLVDEGNDIYSQFNNIHYNGDRVKKYPGNFIRERNENNPFKNNRQKDPYDEEQRGTIIEETQEQRDKYQYEENKLPEISRTRQKNP